LAYNDERPEDTTMMTTTTSQGARLCYDCESSPCRCDELLGHLDAFYGAELMALTMKIQRNDAPAPERDDDEVETDCPWCDGTGGEFGGVCGRCNGAGTIKESRERLARIYAGPGCSECSNPECRNMDCLRDPEPFEFETPEDPEMSISAERRYQITLHRTIEYGQPADLETAVQNALNLMHNGYTSVQIRAAGTLTLVWSNASGKPLPSAAEAERAAKANESWPTCEYIDCDQPSDEGAFCAEHQAEHEANMRAEATGAAVDIYQRLDSSLVDCLASIGQQASKAIEVDRSDTDAVERLSSYLDAISRLQRHADHLLKEIAELS
jgi:hypothetical protein